MLPLRSRDREKKKEGQIGKHDVLLTDPNQIVFVVSLLGSPPWLHLLARTLTTLVSQAESEGERWSIDNTTERHQRSTGALNDYLVVMSTVFSCRRVKFGEVGREQSDRQASLERRHWQQQHAAISQF